MPAAEPATMPFAYAVLRVVPRVERGERLNVGVVRLLPPARLPRAARAASTRRAWRRSRRTSTPRRCAHASTRSATSSPARPRAAPVARLPPSERFGWLVAPSSTIVQPSEVHTG